jgi:hypothetical protein
MAAIRTLPGSGGSRAGCSTSYFSISVTAHAHFVVLMGFGVLPIVPIVQAKTALQNKLSG